MPFLCRHLPFFFFHLTLSAVFVLFWVCVYWWVTQLTEEKLWEEEFASDRLAKKEREAREAAYHERRRYVRNKKKRKIEFQ